MFRRIGFPAHSCPDFTRLFSLGFFVCLASLSVTGCQSPTEEVGSTLGKIEITVASEGAALLPDSLVVLLNGDISGSMGPNGTYTIPFLPPDEYVVALRDEWEHCWLGKNARKVVVMRKKTSTTTFLVRCQ